MRRGRVLSVVLLLVVGVAGVLWWRLRGSNQIEVRTVVLITLDTVRADRLGAYGGPADRTPTLDRLAREGVLFQRALSTAPITLPAHASILSGTDPIAHGVRVNGANGFSADNPSLAKTLKEEGFTTAAFVSATVLDRQYGLANGFDQYECRMAALDGTFDPSPSERRGARTVDAALRFVAENPIPRLFLWVHLFDAHAPYAAPEPFASGHENPYDAEIAYVDECVQRLLDGLSAQKRLDDSLIAVVADHGEGQGEHGESTHTVFVYDSTLHVPMMLWAPGRVPENHVVKSTTSVISLAPTILDILGFEKPPGMYGLSRAAAIMGEVAAKDTDVYFESEAGAYYYGFLPLLGLESDGAKFIRRRVPPDFSGEERRELYYPRQDPGEADDRFSAEPDLRKAMDRRLEEYIARHRTGRVMPRDMSPDEIQRLKELGYTSAFQVGDGALDAVDGIAVVERLIAVASRSEHDPSGAEADLRALIAEEGDIAEAHELLGDLLAASYRRGESDVISGLREACHEWARAAAIRTSTDPVTEMKAADGELMLSMSIRAAAEATGAPVPAEVEELVETAKERCKRVLQQETNNVRARVILARMGLNRDNDPAGSRRLLDEVIDGDLEKGIPPNADDAEARFLRAQCLLALEEFANPRLALKDLQESVRLDPQNNMYLFQLGQLHQHLRQVDEAARIYRVLLGRDIPEMMRNHLEQLLRVLD